MHFYPWQTSDIDDKNQATVYSNWKIDNEFQMIVNLSGIMILKMDKVLTFRYESLIKVY